MVTFDDKRFAEALRQWKGERSYRTIADLTGVRHTTVQRIVEQRHYPSMSTFTLLLTAMNRRAEEFFIR